MLLLQEGAMETVVVHLFVRWQASGICMVLSASGSGIVQQPTTQCSPGLPATGLGSWRK